MYAKRGSRGVAHAAKSLRWSVKYLLKYLIRATNMLTSSDIFDSIIWSWNVQQFITFNLYFFHLEFDWFIIPLKIQFIAIVSVYKKMLCFMFLFIYVNPRLASVGILWKRKRTGSRKTRLAREFWYGKVISFKILYAGFLNFLEIATVLLVYVNPGYPL